MIPGSGLIPLGAWMPTSKIYPCGYYRNRGCRKIDPVKTLHDGMPKTGHEFCGISVVVSEQHPGREHDHGYPWRGREDFVYRPVTSLRKQQCIGWSETEQFRFRAPQKPEQRAKIARKHKQSQGHQASVGNTVKRNQP